MPRDLNSTYHSSRMRQSWKAFWKEGGHNGGGSQIVLLVAKNPQLLCCTGKCSHTLVVQSRLYQLKVTIAESEVSGQNNL